MMIPRFARVLLFLTAFIVYAFDRVTKLVALKVLDAGQPVEVVPGIFNFTLLFNNGAAFGLFKDLAAFFIVVSVIVIACIIVYAWRTAITSVPLVVSLGLILGGALGNLVDRISFSGCVVDFLDFRVWPVFNIADSAISVGVTILILYVLFTKK